MHTGSCLCGGVRYELDAEITEIACCHCLDCRKAQGTAFGTNAPVPASKFKIIAGEDLLSAYESSPGKQRVFCSVCGSPIYSQNWKLPGIVRLRIGVIDTQLKRKPDYHIFAASKAEWYDIHGSAPQHERWKE